MTVPPQVFSSPRGIRRLGLRAWAPALVLLGICVFAWGLRYKLSFYIHPHSTTHRMAEAKLLLTDRSANPVVVLRKASASVDPSATSPLLTALLLLAGMNFWLGRQWAPEQISVHRSPQWFRGLSNFIRPPPRS